MAKKKIYTIATAHLDTIWSWDFETTVSKYIYNTLMDNFTLFKKYPSYRFNFEGTYRYELMEEYYPKEFEKVKEYVKSGQWNVCGSAYENGDTNVPSPEALFRNIIFGNSYFDKTFSKRSVDVFLPDCFGFSWTLPSIAAHANLMGFTTQKLAWGSAYGVPFDIGVWQGVDGEKILANVNPHSYYFNLKKLRDWDFVQDKLKENEKYDFNKTAVFHGIGDRGGAPSEETVSFVDGEIKKNDSSDIEVVAAAADELFVDINNELSKEQIDKLPKWDNELVMRDHGVGGYTSRAIGKRWNRRCEELADMAERAGVMASYLGTYDYNKAELNRSWKRFIAHQFHDDLPGTSVERAYRRSWNDYAMSMNRFTGELEAAETSMTKLYKTDFCTGTPVMVSNPIETDRHGAVTVHLKDIKTNNIRVYDEKGREVKSQVNYQRNGITEAVFIADVPAYGARIYDVRATDVPCKLSGKLSISTENIMENQKYIVSLNRKGNITSILDKEQEERELLSEPISLGLFKYNGSKVWPAWEMNYDEANKDPDRIPNVVTITIKESGPARVAFCVEQKDNNSTFKNIIALTDGGEIVEVYSEIEWQNLRTMAKNKFAFNCKNDKATFDLGLGAIERENMNDVLYEVPAQKWADITDKSGEWGVSVISECKYGWDKYKDNTLRMTVLHTPKHNYRIDSMQSMLDLGLNRYSYAIFSHKGKVGEKTQMQARQFIQPMTAYTCTKHQGVLGKSSSFIDVSTNAVIIRAVKMAEESDDVIIRLNEGTNTDVQNYKIKLFDGIESARELYASEEYKADAVVQNGYLVTSFKPYEVKTFALKLNQPKLVGDKTKSNNSALKMDKILVTSQGESGDFDLTIPREIIPDTLKINGVDYQIDGKGTVCKGQKVDISNGTDTLSMLVGADVDKTVGFTVDGENVSKKVYSMTERFAAWDLYNLHETAYVKTGKLGFIATHSHTNGNDNIAKELYFYVLNIDVKGKSEVVLPTDENIVILSCSEVSGADGELLTPTYDEVEKRPFEYKMTFSDKLKYVSQRNILAMHDKQDYFKDKNKGRLD